MNNTKNHLPTDCAGGKIVTFLQGNAQLSENVIAGLLLSENGIAKNTAKDRENCFPQMSHLSVERKKKVFVVGVFSVFEYDECAHGWQEIMLNFGTVQGVGFGFAQRILKQQSEWRKCMGIEPT